MCVIPEKRLKVIKHIERNSFLKVAKEQNTISFSILGVLLLDLTKKSMLKKKRHIGIVQYFPFTTLVSFRSTGVIISVERHNGYRITMIKAGQVLGWMVLCCRWTDGHTKGR